MINTDRYNPRQQSSSKKLSNIWAPGELRPAGGRNLLSLFEKPRWTLRSVLQRFFTKRSLLKLARVCKYCSYATPMRFHKKETLFLPFPILCKVLKLRYYTPNSVLLKKEKRWTIEKILKNNGLSLWVTHFVLGLLCHLIKH